MGFILFPRGSVFVRHYGFRLRCILLPFCLLFGIPLLTELGLFYYIGVGIVVLIFTYEHAIVKPDDLSRVNLAFFTLNGMISLVLMALSIADILL